MISNASPLILFAKINEIELLNVFEELIIHREVYTEIMKGKQSNNPDAFIIENFVRDGKIKVLDLNKEGEKVYMNLVNKYRSLDVGEAATIALALQRKEKKVLVDESISRKVARLMGLKPVGSLGIVLIAYKMNIIDEKRVREVVRKMVSTDFRVSASVIERFWELFEKQMGRK